MGYQTAPYSSLGFPSGLYQFMSFTESTAVLFNALTPPLAPHLSLSPAPITSHPPTPIDSIRDITGTEKTIPKPAAFK